MDTLRILVVDDDALVREMLARILVAANHEVTKAADGNEGLHLFDGGAFDLVITDILMPEMEGIETIQELRRRNRETKIIAISGGDRSGNKMYLAMAEKLGADGVLAKPIRQKDLLDKIDSLLSA